MYLGCLFYRTRHNPLNGIQKSGIHQQVLAHRLTKPCLRYRLLRTSSRNTRLSRYQTLATVEHATTMRLSVVRAAVAALLFAAAAHASLGDRLPVFKACVTVFHALFILYLPSSSHHRNVFTPIATLTAHLFVCDRP